MDPTKKILVVPEPNTETPRPEEQAPYLCPNCLKPATHTNITINPNGPNGFSIVTFWHQGCKAILSMQLLPQPRQIQIPQPQGRIILQQ